MSDARIRRRLRLAALALAWASLAGPASAWAAGEGPVDVEPARAALVRAVELARSVEELRARREELRKDLESTEAEVARAREQRTILDGMRELVVRETQVRRQLLSAALLVGLRRAREPGTDPMEWAGRMLWPDRIGGAASAGHLARAELEHRLAELAGEIAAGEVKADQLREQLRRIEMRLQASEVERLHAALELDELERRRTAVRAFRADPIGDVPRRDHPAGAPHELVAVTARTTTTSPGLGERRFRLPVEGSIVRRFGERRDGQRVRGVVVATDRPQPVVAPRDGVVAFAGPFRDAGLLLIIEHPDAYHSLVMGMSRLEVRTGEVVSEGQRVGWVDRDPPARPGVYVELRHVGEPIDPLSVMLAHEGEVRG